jgi:hypothetical protein
VKIESKEHECNNDSNGLCCIGRDITENKNTSKKLQQVTIQTHWKLY